MNWRGEARTVDGVVERDYDLAVETRTVPGTLWAPESANAPTPLVLLGYGGGGHRRDGARMWQGGWYARKGIAATSIDLLGHGERALPGGARPDYGLLINDIIAEWRACLDLVAALPEIDEGRIGYRGVSMGTMLGIPFVAAELRIRVAMLAGADFQDYPGLFTGIGARLRQDVPRVICPILFHVGWDDDEVERESALELFGLFGATDKEMRVRPGGHGEVAPGTTEAGMQWLADRLQAIN
jgi:fermentation-respiration switch protein FrsA (DUF1100 family)